MSINDNHTCKNVKIQGMMNRLIYWLSEELVFVMRYQCHHYCVLLFVDVVRLSFPGNRRTALTQTAPC